MTTAHTVVVPGVGVKWQVRDGADVVYESTAGYEDATAAAAAAAEALGTEWPGSETDGTWHYVGDSGEPAFESTWGSAGTVAFRIREAGVVDLSLGVSASPDPSSNKITVLDVGYRPLSALSSAAVIGRGRRSGASVDMPVMVIPDPDGSLFVYPMDDSGPTPVFTSVYAAGMFFVNGP